MAWFPVLPQDFSFSLVSQGFEDLVGYSIREMQCKDRVSIGCWMLGCAALMAEYSLSVIHVASDVVPLFHDSVLRFPTHIMWAYLSIDHSSILQVTWHFVGFPTLESSISPRDIPWLWLWEAMRSWLDSSRAIVSQRFCWSSCRHWWAAGVWFALHGTAGCFRDVESLRDNNHVKHFALLWFNLLYLNLIPVCMSYLYVECIHVWTL